MINEKRRNKRLSSCTHGVGVIFTNIKIGTVVEAYLCIQYQSVSDEMLRKEIDTDALHHRSNLQTQYSQTYYSIFHLGNKMLIKSIVLPEIDDKYYE